jgi:hypothetical protein
VGIVVAHWLVVSGAGEGWWAGATYGPRFMADMIPIAAFLAIPAVVALVERRTRPLVRGAAAALGVVSILMHLPGAWSKPAHCWNLEPPRVDDDPARVWDWSDMQALEPIRMLADGASPREAVMGSCDELLDT